MRSILGAAIAVIVIAAFRIPAGAGAQPPPGDPYLPDLRTLDPSEFRISESTENDHRLLLLSNTIWNAGDGPLEMHPENDTSTNETHAFQLIYSEDADGMLYQVDEHEAGTFAFHPQHNHWHFKDLARYQLFTIGPDGDPDELVAESDKISFCMFDQVQPDPTLPNAAGAPHYFGQSCSQNTNVGYSVSWGDEYRYDFADQDIDIEGVEPGRYWVVSTADPEDLIIETNNANNAARVAIELTDERVRSLTETSGELCRPCGTTHLTRDDRYAFKGSTSPTPATSGSEIKLSFKKEGASGWKSFGSSDSDRAFVLTRSSDDSITSGGEWRVAFRATKAGRWVVRARFPGDTGFADSARRIQVEVG